MDFDRGHPRPGLPPGSDRGGPARAARGRLLYGARAFRSAGLERIRQRTLAAARETDARIAAGDVAELETLTWRERNPLYFHQDAFFVTELGYNVWTPDVRRRDHSSTIE